MRRRAAKYANSYSRCGLAALCLLCSVSLSARQEQFTIQVNTKLIVETVSVTGKDGKPIEGLTKDDFTLTEDGVPQTISVFEFEKLDDSVSPPSSATSTTAPAASRITPSAPGALRYQDRRLLVLYFDMSTMGDAERFRALGSARTFIEKQMKGPDLLSIITYSDGAVRVRRDFTDDRETLYGTINTLLNGEDSNDYNSDFGQDSGEFNIFNTDRQLSALQTAVQMLETTTDPVERIARNVGLASPFSLYRLVMKHTGKSPLGHRVREIS